MPDMFALTFDELCGELTRTYGKGEYHARALFREILARGNRNWSLAPEFQASKALARRLEADLSVPMPVISKLVRENDTIKFLCRFDDGLESESVIIPMRHHTTLCVSSQIGCRMNCRFCQTGAMGFVRNLRASEIVGQVFAARFVLGQPIRNLVFMGMGEPFDNMDAVIRAVRVLSDQRGFDIAHRHITLSTAGRVDGIDRLAALGWPSINLALSLNAPNDRLRDELMPINRKYPTTELKLALMRYPLRRRGLFLIEYVLIRDLNDAETHAAELATFLEGLPVRINLIPLNPTAGFAHTAPSDQEVHLFASYLEDRGLFVVKRWSKGGSLAAGCGQLGSEKRS
ncbi:23S rRNA (adenine(2503)-C(2))-methyltransferase RlmN [Desulfatiferula olefinivorans]